MWGAMTWEQWEALQQQMSRPRDRCWADNDEKQGDCGKEAIDDLGLCADHRLAYVAEQA
jgi:hypothetical protein